MTIKTETRLIPQLLSNRQYSGMVATLLYNWPIFMGGFLFSLVVFLLSSVVPTPWHWLFLLSGFGVLAVLVATLSAAYLVYDWGEHHEYDRLAELGQLDQAGVLVDITCGKLRGSRGFLRHFKGGHYFLIDIFNAAKMTDQALQRARTMEPSLQAERRIFQRTGQPDRLPIPPNWVDVITCHYSLHEIKDEADRTAIFNQFARMIKPKGRLLVVEHDRNWLNFLAFGPGAFSFFPTATWLNHIDQAGLRVTHHERWRGLVNLWVLERK